ncbi:MAG: hypothetical protein KJI69_04325 [Patescibacteria group bacterium]|nr:hypothetical protein [Patescibacteria group bacterium]
MGAGGTIIGLLILIIIVVIAWGYIQNFIVEILLTGDRLGTAIFTSEELEATPTSEEMVCDLRVTVFATVDERFPFDVFVRVPDSSGEVKRYFWTDCSPAKATSLFSLLDISENLNEALGNLGQLAFFSEEDVITVNIRLTDPKTGDIIDKFNRGNLEKQIGDLQNKNTPFDIQQQFFIPNVPHRDYDLEIFYGRAINELPIGTPFVDEVCQFTKTTCLVIR